MNLLGLVFGILFVCICTFSLSTQKNLLFLPIEKSCCNHFKASRKILDSYEREYYKSLRSVKKETSQDASKPKQISTQRAPQETKNTAPALNRDCSRLNLRPLIENGRDEHPVLYETAAKILHSLYGRPLFKDEVRLEYQILDAILHAAKSEETAPLEKLSLPENNVKRPYTLQMIYYRMLKGTKPAAKNGYPCLSDYFAIEKNDSPLCLKHASMEMLSALFNPKAADLFYKEMRKNKQPPSKERLVEICSQSGLTTLSDEFLNLLDLERGHHDPSNKKILVEQQGDVTLRKQVFFKTSQSEARS